MKAKGEEIRTTRRAAATDLARTPRPSTPRRTRTRPPNDGRERRGSGAGSRGTTTRDEGKGRAESAARLNPASHIANEDHTRPRRPAESSSMSRTIAQADAASIPSCTASASQAPLLERRRIVPSFLVAGLERGVQTQLRAELVVDGTEIPDSLVRSRREGGH